MPIMIPRSLKRRLRSLYQRMIEAPPPPNLQGDRDIEYSWIASNMPSGPGRALDFGAGAGWLGLLAARKGYETISLDLTPVSWFYRHPSLSFTQDDILRMTFPSDHFDLIINCSAIEHVGLSGRYGVLDSRPDGDMDAMKALRRILRLDGTMLLTIPVGRDSVFSPLHRVYGEKRLATLMEGWTPQKKEYWIKGHDNKWVTADESEALNEKPSSHYYGLGLFSLSKTGPERN